MANLTEMEIEMNSGASTSTSNKRGAKRKTNVRKEKVKKQKLGDLLSDAREKALDNIDAKRAFFSNRTTTESVFEALFGAVMEIFGKQTHLVGVKMALSAILQMLKNTRGKYLDENGAEQSATAKVRGVDGKEVDMPLTELYEKFRRYLARMNGFKEDSFTMDKDDRKPKGILAAQLLQVTSLFCAVFVGVSEWLTGRAASFCSRNGWNLELCALSGYNSLTDGAKRQMLDVLGLATRADYLRRLHERSGDGKKTRDISTMSKVVGSMRVAGNADTNRMLNFIIESEDFSLFRHYLVVSSMHAHDSRMSKVLYNPVLFLGDGTWPKNYFEDEKVRRSHAATATYTYLAPSDKYNKCLAILTYLAVDGSLYITKDQLKMTGVAGDMEFDRNMTKKVAAEADPKYNTMKMSVSKMTDKGWVTRSHTMKGVKLLVKPTKEAKGRQGKDLGVSQDGKVTDKGLREMEFAPVGVSSKAGISSKEEFLSLYTTLLQTSKATAHSDCIFNV